MDSQARWVLAVAASLLAGCASPGSSDPAEDDAANADGGATTDAGRLMDQLEWFAGNVYQCTVTMDDGGFSSTYQSVSIELLGDGPEKYDVHFELGGDQGASTDSVWFPVDVLHGATLTIGQDSSGETRYEYDTTIGWSQTLVLTVGASGTASLFTYDASDHIEVNCITSF